jgi:hypothetical protein
VSVLTYYLNYPKGVFLDNYSLKNNGKKSGNGIKNIPFKIFSRGNGRFV